jgi:hypothetical protein
MYRAFLSFSEQKFYEHSELNLFRKFEKKFENFDFCLEKLKIV